AHRPASADVLQLQSGERIEGVVREYTPAGVVIEIAEQSIRFEASAVRAIYFGQIPLVATAPAPSASPQPSTSASPQPSTPPSAAGVLQLMKSLRPGATGNARLSEYQARVLAAAPVVDLYLAGLAPGTGADAVRDAMRYHELAGSA